MTVHNDTDTSTSTPDDTPTDPQVSIPQDEPTKRASILDMSDEQLEAMLDGIRERRLRLQRLYEEQLQARISNAVDKLDERINKQLDMLTKEVERCNNTLEKAEDRVNKIRAFRLQRGDLLEQQPHHDGSDDSDDSDDHD